jgi:hypothetical protein
MLNNNNNNNNNRLRNHNLEEKGGGEKNNSFFSEPKKERKIVSEQCPKNVISVISVISEAPASDHGLNSEPTEMISEAPASDHGLNYEDFENNLILNSEPSASDQRFDTKTLVVNSEKDKMISELTKMNSEPQANYQDLNSEAHACDHGLNSEPSEIRVSHNSDLISLLKKALIKFAFDDYKGVVSDIDDFIRRFNQRVPEYKEALGIDAVGYNAKKLHIRGWR